MRTLAIVSASGLSHDQGDQATVKDLLKKDSSIQDAVFGVLYTLSKEKYAQSRKFAIAAIILDFVQMVVFMIGAPFPWHFNTDNVLFKVVNYIQLNNPLVALGYPYFLVVFLLLSLMLVASAAMCVFVAHNFKTGHFPFVWPIKVLRFFISIFFSVFYISSLNTFMVAFDAKIKNLPLGQLPYLEAFPTKHIFDTGNLMLSGFGILMCVVFFVIALLLELANSEQDPLTNNLLGTPDSKEGTILFLLKTLMTIVATLVSDPEYMKIQALVLCLASWLIQYRQLRWVPCYSPFINRLRSALFSSLAMQAGVLILLVFFPSASTELTIVMAVLSMLAVPAGWYAANARLKRSISVASKFLNKPVKAPEDDEEEYIHEFRDPQEVEICSRCLQEDQRKRKRVMIPNEAQLNAAELILLTGLTQFPDSALLHIIYASFLISLRHNNSQAQFHMERARSLNPGARERFMIFVRDRERKHSAQSESTGEASMDLVSYVEFQNNYNLSLASHRLALKATRRFWRVVIGHDVTFRALSSAFNNIDSAESKANKAYRAVLERYPRSVKLLRSYACFLEEVRNDPWGARKYYNEADRQEEALAQANQEAGQGGEGRIDDSKDGIVVINKVGIIQFTNKVTLKLFGYKKDELWGKNVRILMPQPYSGQHDSYITAYNTTGKAKIIGTTRALEAKHKEGHTFPVALSVTKVETNGDTSFTGVLRPVEDGDTATVTLSLPNCTVQAVNKVFSNMFGYKVGDIVGKNIRKLIAQRHLPALANVREYLAQFEIPTDENGEVAAAKKSKLDAVHKSGDEFPISMEVVARQGEAADSGLLELRIQSLNDQLGILTIDVRGQIVSANKQVCAMFGHSEEGLLAMNVSQVMPLPYSRFHSMYLRRFAATGKGSSRVIGTVGRTVMGLHRDGSTFAMALEVREIRDEITNARLFSGRITLADPRRRDVNRVDSITTFDGDIKSASESSIDMLGSASTELEGMYAVDILDFPDGERVPLNERLAKRMQELRGVACWTAQAKQANGSSVPVSVVIEEAEYDAEPVVSAQLWALSLLEGVIGINDLGVITQANRGVELMCGYSNRELVGSNVTKLMPPEVAAEHGNYLAAYKATGKKKVINMRRPVMAVHKDGSSICIDLEVAEVGRATAGLADGTVYIARLVVGQPGEEALAAANSSSKPGGLARGVNDRLMRASESEDAVRKRPALANLPSPNAERAQVTHKQQLMPAPRLPGRSSPSLNGLPLISDGGVARMGAHLPYALEAFIKDRMDDIPDALPDKHSPPAGDAVEGPLSPGRKAVRFSLTDDDADDGPTTKASPRDDKERELRLDALCEEPNPASPTVDESERMSAVDPSEVTDSEYDSKDGGGANFQRAKRYRSILKLVSNSKMRGAIAALVFHTRIIAIILVLSHVVCFAVMRTETQSQMNLESQIKSNATVAVVGDNEQKMTKALDALEVVLNGMYLGFKKLKEPDSQPLRRLFDDPILNITELADTTPPRYKHMLYGLWDAAKFYLQAGRQVATPHNHTHDEDTAAWQYVMTNVPVICPAFVDAQYDVADRTTQHVVRVQHIQTVVYVLEGGFVCVLTVVYLWTLLRRVAEERIALFTVFLFVPRPIVRSLASRPISMSTEESDDEASDHEFQNKQNVGKKNDDDNINLDAASPSNNGAAADSNDLEAIKQKVRRGFKTNAVVPMTNMTKSISLNSRQRKLRKLNSRGADSYRFLIPSAGFALLTLVSFIVGTLVLRANKAPLADTNGAQMASYLKTAVRFYAQELVLAQTNGNAAGLPELRQLLNSTANELQHYHEALLYGDRKLGLSGALYRYKANINLLFGHGCLAANPANCYNSTDKWYSVTNNGLDGLVYYYIQQAELLSEDADADLNWDNERFQFLWVVGTNILTDAFDTYLNNYYSTIQVRSQTNLVVQIMIFVAICLGLCGTYLYYLKPFFERTHVESKRVAELLSQLPTTIKIEQIIQEADSSKQ
eukprot:jgi/Chlat1/6285/Chrsp44S05780